MVNILQFRMLAIANGYEDGNDASLELTPSRLLPRYARSRPPARYRAPKAIGRAVKAAGPPAATGDEVFRLEKS